MEWYILFFSSNGFLKQEQNYLFGKRHGTTKTYSKAGYIEKIDYYNMDTLFISKFLSKKGKVLNHKIYPYYSYTNDSLKLGDTFRVKITLPTSKHIISPILYLLTTSYKDRLKKINSDSIIFKGEHNYIYVPKKPGLYEFRAGIKYEDTSGLENFEIDFKDFSVR